MYASLLPEKAREEYGVSRWKGLLDERGGSLLDRGYSPITVGEYLRQWVDFVRNYETNSAVLPTDVRSPEVNGYLDRRWGQRPHRGSTRAALRHLLHEAQHIRCLRKERRSASELFEKHVPDYLSFARKHRGHRSSRGVERTLRDFCDWLGRRGFHDIAKVEPATLRDFLGSMEHLKRSTVAFQASALRGFLRYLGFRGVVHTELATVIESPRLYRMSSPPSVLDEEIVERLIAAVDRTTSLGKRDYAMLLLAARYGLRPSDIRSLRLEDVRWREQRILMLQSKTQRVLELPLMADVEEALVDYLRNGRPASDVREVFLRHVVPFIPFVESNNLWRVMRRAFKAADIEPPRRQHGLYLLRHTLATRMLGSGVPFDTISDVLGHASVDTTRIYAQVDLKGLRSVALRVREVCR